MQKYVNINEKHIIMQNDFETIEDLIKRIKIVLENGEKKFENSEKIQIDNGKYRLILDKSISGNISVLTIFNFFVNDYQKLRSPEEQEKKRKELIL